MKTKANLPHVVCVTDISPTNTQDTKLTNFIRIKRNNRAQSPLSQYNAQSCDYPLYIPGYGRMDGCHGRLVRRQFISAPVHLCIRPKAPIVILVITIYSYLLSTKSCSLAVSRSRPRPYFCCFSWSFSSSSPSILLLLRLRKHSTQIISSQS